MVVVASRALDRRPTAAGASSFGLGAAAVALGLSGFAPVAEVRWDGTYSIGVQATGYGGVGRLRIDRASPSPDPAVITDATAPAGKALRFTYPAGMTNANQDPGRVYVWAPDGSGNLQLTVSAGAPYYRYCYIRRWWKLTPGGTGWEFLPPVVKYDGYVGIGQPGTNPGLELPIDAFGSGQPSGALGSNLYSAMLIGQEFQSQIGNAYVTAHEPFVGLGVTVAVGSWVDQEVLIECGTVDGNDGRYRTWVNGTLAVDTGANVDMLQTANGCTTGVYGTTNALYYGGGFAGSKAQTDYFDLGYVYIAGHN